MGKSVHMHFRPNLNASERLTCARTREYGSEYMLKLGNQKLKRVDEVKLLGRTCPTFNSKIKIKYCYDQTHN